MKQGTVVNRFVILLLAAAVVIYLAVYAWNSFTNPLTTVLSYTYAVDDAAEATGFLVREETILPTGTGTIERLPAEGERVAKGEEVALIYQNTAALDRRQTLQRLELELEQLRSSLRQDGAARDAARLSQEIMDAMSSLRTSVAAGNLTKLEEQAVALRSLVYQRAYTYGGSGSEAALEEAVRSKEAEIAALSGQMADTYRITASQPGIFSGVVDGYEDLLTPEGIADLTPSALDRLSAQQVEADGSAVGKLITSATWYFVCALPDQTAGRLYEGLTVPVRFSRDWSGEVEMTVESIGEPEAGRRLVVLASNRFLSDTTLLRRQTVSLVFGTTEGIRIPKRAVRVETRASAAEEGGEPLVRQVTGVYAVVGVQAEFKPVTVLLEEDDYCLVRPEEPEDGAKKILRTGDEIIVTARDLFDGKVVR